ncbi:DUF2520 domain-containing protein [Antarcticibacterium flavum]|uniref:DUF2520 domain-containing protein n=1 Tax=Antarcticibacterium flavum TaxID=2058175 RepID=A0A5B7X0X0_9FLAO|nr:MULTISPECIES: DUF2520 domain-containing protein [Antarcticibacterium]MCM4159013.1 DUF2520 domain-containing protein [Antarcticibacterium sp. W02-3]QCY68261.1 DUF2520 domain-containing protein [Antarcticibacterium flavum]
MKSIVLFGAGNVATHLFRAFAEIEDYEVIQVYNHREKSLEFFKEKVPVTTDFTEVFPADIYLFALKDEAISLLADRVHYRDALMLHTSGATPLAAFESFEKAGVFYPLQTFSKNKPVDFKEIPICIEAKNESQLKMTEQLALKISPAVYKINSEQRRSLHVAAVFVSNFVNFLYSQGEQICRQNKIPFEILHPLIKETALKIKNLSPFDAQTGPAKRGDSDVINEHLGLLNEDQKTIYNLLTNSIKKLHGKEL